MTALNISPAYSKAGATDPHSVCAVTGCGGFIGNAICAVALRQNLRVVGIGPVTTCVLPDLQHRSESIRSRTEMVDCLSDVDLLFHAAGRSTPSATRAIDESYMQDELQATACVLEAAAQAQVAKVVLISSGGTVYGDIDQPESIRESQPTAPRSRYGLLKVLLEQMGLYMSRVGLLDCVITRISNPYGPGQRNHRGQGIIPTAIELIASGKRVPIWGDGNTVRDYLYIDDVASGLLAASRLASGSICNVSSGAGRSTREVICDIAEMMNRPLEIIYEFDRDPGIQRNVLSYEFLMRETGWYPTVSWEDGLRRTLTWWDDKGDVKRARSEC